VHHVTWFLHAVFITSCCALAGAAAGIVLLLLKRWALAHRVAKRVSLMALVVLGIAVAELQVLWSAPGVVAPLIVRALPAGDPSLRARALAEGISELMNCAALAVPAAALGGIAWVVSRARLRRPPGAGRVARSR
jgi:hypothetical protein